MGTKCASGYRARTVAAARQRTSQPFCSCRRPIPPTTRPPGRDLERRSGIGVQRLWRDPVQDHGRAEPVLEQVVADRFGDRDPLVGEAERDAADPLAPAPAAGRDQVQGRQGRRRDQLRGEQRPGRAALVGAADVDQVGGDRPQGAGQAREPRRSAVAAQPADGADLSRRLGEASPGLRRRSLGQHADDVVGGREPGRQGRDRELGPADLLALGDQGDDGAAIDRVPRHRSALGGPLGGGLEGGERGLAAAMLRPRGERLAAREAKQRADRGRLQEEHLSGEARSSRQRLAAPAPAQRQRREQMPAGEQARQAAAAQRRDRDRDQAEVRRAGRRPCAGACAPRARRRRGSRARAAVAAARAGRADPPASSFAAPIRPPATASPPRRSRPRARSGSHHRPRSGRAPSRGRRRRRPRAAAGRPSGAPRPARRRRRSSSAGATRRA